MTNCTYYLYFIQHHKLFVHTGSSDVIMVTSVWIAILYVMDGMNVLMVVMSGTGTVVCDENIFFLLSNFLI